MVAVPEKTREQAMEILAAKSLPRTLLGNRELDFPF